MRTPRPRTVMSNKAIWPRPWRRWNGNYQKAEYDVMLLNGEVHHGCWPNAGKMNRTDGKDGSWRPNQVKAIRLSKWPMMSERRCLNMSSAEIMKKRKAEPKYEPQTKQP